MYICIYIYIWFQSFKHDIGTGIRSLHKLAGISRLRADIFAKQHKFPGHFQSFDGVAAPVRAPFLMSCFTNGASKLPRIPTLKTNNCPPCVN